MSDKKLKKGPEPLKAYVAFKHKVTYARRSPSPVTVVPSSNPPNPPPSTPVRGLSPVQSYLQSQWPRDIRNSLSNAVNSVEAQTEPQENSASDENQDACENCIIKSLTEEGKALRELKRIRQVCFFIGTQVNFRKKGKDYQETDTTATATTAGQCREL